MESIWNNSELLDKIDKAGNILILAIAAILLLVKFRLDSLKPAEDLLKTQSDLAKSLLESIKEFPENNEYIEIYKQVKALRIPTSEYEYYKRLLELSEHFSTEPFDDWSQRAQFVSHTYSLLLHHFPEQFFLDLELVQQADSNRLVHYDISEKRVKTYIRMLHKAMERNSFSDYRTTIQLFLLQIAGWPNLIVEFKDTFKDFIPEIRSSWTSNSFRTNYEVNYAKQQLINFGLVDTGSAQ